MRETGQVTETGQEPQRLPVAVRGGRELAVTEGASEIDEDKDAVRLAADLPGMDPKSVEISIEDDVLTLKGERKREKKAEGNGFHRSERYFGAFERRFSLPQTVDRDKIEANYRDGVLYLTLPKRDEVKPKKIQVAVS